MGDRNHIQTIQTVQNQNCKHKPHSKILPLPIQNTTLQPMEVLQHYNEHEHHIQRIRIHTIPQHTKHRTHNPMQTTNTKIHKHPHKHQKKSKNSNNLTKKANKTATPQPPPYQTHPAFSHPTKPHQKEQPTTQK